MTPRELIEKWERDARESLDIAKRVDRDYGKFIGAPFRQRAADCSRHAAELRAALPEQPLSRKWREGGQERYSESRKCNDDYGRGYYRGYTDASEKCAADLDSYYDKGREESRRLRILLALSYSGGNLYADDGELQDASKHPFIDWRRDSIDELERKVKERGYDRIRNHLGGERLTR